MANSYDEDDTAPVRKGKACRRRTHLARSDRRSSTRHPGVARARAADDAGCRRPGRRSGPLALQAGPQPHALVLLVTEETLLDLEKHLDAVPSAADPRETLADLLRAFRAFAHARPAGYHLIFAGAPGPTRPDPARLARAAAPRPADRRRTGRPAQALEAARTITAWAYGFISMELADAFNLGGDVDRAYEYGLTHLAAALTEEA